MGEHGEGGMMALTMDVDSARAVADRHYCQVASCNLPEQTVVGGGDADLESLAQDVAENHPRKKAVPLATEGAKRTVGNSPIRTVIVRAPKLVNIVTG